LVLDHVCIGVVIEVIGRRRCKVIIQVVAERYATDLKPGVRYYLTHLKGKISPNVPRAIGSVIQCVGIAVSRTDLLVVPDFHRMVIRSDSPTAQLYWNPMFGCYELR
jgi:hypothetical protein